MRKARVYSKSGYYHNVVRGVNKEYIFYSKSDKTFFKSLLRKYGKKYKVFVHSYVLMNNHVHLLLEDKNHNISKFMQIVTSVYARYFNKKYDRVGHLFQDRYDSEPVENIEYFITVFRYIIQNPEIAGICKAADYEWSSYHCYKKKRTFVKTSLIRSYFKNIETLYTYLNDFGTAECLEPRMRPSEKEFSIIKKIKTLLNSDNPIIPPEIPRTELEKKIKTLRAAHISIRNIARITGINKWIIEKINSGTYQNII